MAKSKSGRPFEKMVALIQEAYKDSPHTKIYTNHKIKDRFGKLREFDVFIVVKSNDYEFRIAIECKDYSSPVSVEKIEAFHSKCSTVNNINKKVLISSNGFQSGAIENAEHFDIELQTLSTIKKVAMPVKDGNSTGYMALKIEILDYMMTVKNDIFGEVDFRKESIDDKSSLAFSGNDPIPTMQFLYQEIHKLGARKEMLVPLQKEAMKRGVLLFEGDITITDSFIISPLPNNPINVYVSNVKSSVSKITIWANITCRSRGKDSKEVEVRSHNDILESRKGELYTVQFDETETQFFYEQLDKEGKYLGTTAVNHGQSTKLSTEFDIDTTTGKFTDKRS